MSAQEARNQEVRDQAQPDDTGAPRDRIALYRSYLRNNVTFQGMGRAWFQGRGFEGLSWEYFLADVELEALAARLKVSRDGTLGSIEDTIGALPPTGILRLMTSYIAYFTPPDNEALVDERLQEMDAATIKRLRQRRHAVLAAEAITAQHEEARKEAQAQDEALRAEWYACPRATLSAEPEDFLPWIKAQTPDTWHVIVGGWDYNDDDRDDVIEWIFDQPNCDLGTVAQFFFTGAVGLADQDPEQLSPGYRRSWLLLKRVADNWQRGHYVRNELQHSVEPSDIEYYDELAARREAEGRPLPWKVPAAGARKFGTRQPNSAYHYEHRYLKLTFEVWKRHRERSGCGKDYPRCCQG